jgi:hypothetical protein
MVTRSASRAVLLGAVVLAFAVASAAFSAQGIDSSLKGGGIHTDRQVIGPGKVRFAQTRNGAWLEIVPAWTNGASLITGGGFAVYAEDTDGRIVELVATGPATLDVPEVARGLGKCCEGMANGCRGPSLDPDDDRDGRADEDRLDGIDNDNDGKIDEDFAAIGDEMIVTEYFTRDPETDLALEFHQETYAWSLPNINGAIMLNLQVSNAGETPLRNVRVVAYYERKGAFDLSETIIEATPKRADDRTSRSSMAVVSSDGRGSNLALVGFAASTDGGLDWISGYAESLEDMERSVAEAIVAERGDGMPRTESVQRIVEKEMERVTDGAIVYHMASNFDRLEPGQKRDVNLAIVVAPQLVQIDGLSALALETYLGDDTNRYVPPPVSMTPRALWARYEPDEANEHVVLIDIQDSGDDRVGPENISYF